MDKHDRFIAINQTLPGLEDFLKIVLGSEPLSESANRQRIEFLRRLESVSRPPSLPPRPANLGELLRARQLHNETQPQAGSCVQDEGSAHYRNEKPLDPIEFASQQRELSRAANIYRSYVPQRNAICPDEGSKTGGLYIPRPGIAAHAGNVIRDSIKSTSSGEDDLYERLSLIGVTPDAPSPRDSDVGTSTDESFVFPSPPKTPQDPNSSIYGGARGGSFRASGGRGKLHSGWFKKESKVYEEVYVSNLTEPVIKGYLKDVKTNKRRWCVLQSDRLHIFKNREDPAIMIINLPDCSISIDDKKKISYSFRLNPADGPGVSLAIEDGCDLSPWMSAIMAAAVRRSNLDRPNSPLEGAFTLEEARLERKNSIKVDGGIQEQAEDDTENLYEKPMDYLPDGLPVDQSTPTQIKSDSEDDGGYDAPLPPLPDNADNSSSESSSDEDESVERKDDVSEKAKRKKIYDEIPADLLAELLAEQKKGPNETNKSQDSICEGGSTNDNSHDFTDSHSEHSGNVSNRHSYTELLASDDTGSSEPKDENSEHMTRKRTSTVLSNVSMESVCSDVECTQAHPVSSERSGFKVKRRRRLVPPDTELQFLQDPNAMHSGILYKKRRLGVWSKRYCKIVNNRFKCYRSPSDWKPSLDFAILGYDISLIDSKESRKSYCIKISHPSKDTFYFATDSRVSVERWIEVLSLVATGRVDIIAPYPPYFCGGHSGDETVNRSRESLLSSEGRLSDDDSADALDDADAVSGRSRMYRTTATTVGDKSVDTLATSELDGIASTDTKDVDISSASQNEKEINRAETHQGTQQKPSDEGIKERVQKKRKGKPSDKEGTKTPSTMSPPHSMFISESASGEAKPEPVNENYSSPVQGSAKETSEETSTKKDRRWTEALKKKQAKLARGYSLDQRLRGNAPSQSSPEVVKNKILTIRRKNSHSFAHLVTLFDKEGRFSGYLTEVRYKKFGTTHLRRWCVVKNGVLNVYNNETEETPQAKLSLVDMWMTDRSDESRSKFAFALEDKEGNETILQTSVKEDYQKWMGVLELFTELRVERPDEVTVPQKEPVKKTDSSTSEDGDGLPESRGTIRSKNPRAVNEHKEDIYSSTSKVRSSLRMKISQRVNVRDIFRKSHSSYDMEGAVLDEAPVTNEDVNTVAVFGGLLSEIDPSGAADVTGKPRWCSVKEKELLVFTDSKASDPLRKMPLCASVISNLSDPDNNVFRFKVRHANESIVLDTSDSADLSRWLRMLTSATERRNSSEDERPKCVGRLTSPTFAKKKLLVRRTRSEAFPHQPSSDSPSTVQWFTVTKERSVNTDRLMSGYLQQVRETNGARTLLRRWCVATSELFIVYDNQNSKKASYEWPLSKMEVEDHSDLDAGSFGFSVLRGEERLHFQVIDEDSARHWLSVLTRYCHTVAASQTNLKPKSGSLRRAERGRSASDNDLQAKNNDRETNLLEVLSEGRASGKKLVRRISEDNSFFSKFSKPDLFKVPRRGSTEKLEVKLREKSGSSARRSSKRFSCGSLFNSEGKYSGHLMELTTSELYSSQVRRWCLQSDDFLYVYEHEAADIPVKTIPLFNAKVFDKSDLEACVYRFRIEYGENNAVFFRALTRSDLEKWTTVISVKTAVLQDRCERRLRRSRTLSSEKSAKVTGSRESGLTSPEFKPSRSAAVDSGSLNETASLCSGDSVFVLEGDNASSATVETLSTSSNDVKSSEIICSPSDDKGELGPSCAATSESKGTRPVDGQMNEEIFSLPSSKEDSRSFSETENACVKQKTVSNVTHIDELSHIYENFLAFASEMVEKSPEFQKQLYHIYENVSFAYDTKLQNSSQSNADEYSGEAAEVVSTESELKSPSVDMASEFEKISLQEKEDITYRYSGICGESVLENLDESLSEQDPDLSASDSLTVGLTGVENESIDEREFLTSNPVVECVASCEQAFLEGAVSSDDEDDVLNRTLVEESLNREMTNQGEHCSSQEEKNFDLRLLQDNERDLEGEVASVLRRIIDKVAASEEVSVDLRELVQTQIEDQIDRENESKEVSNSSECYASLAHPDDGCAIMLVDEEKTVETVDKETTELVCDEIEVEEISEADVNTRQTSEVAPAVVLRNVPAESEATEGHLCSETGTQTVLREEEATRVDEQEVKSQNASTEAQAVEFSTLTEAESTMNSDILETDPTSLGTAEDQRWTAVEGIKETNDNEEHIDDVQVNSADRITADNEAVFPSEDVTLVSDEQFQSHECLDVAKHSSGLPFSSKNSDEVTKSESIAVIETLAPNNDSVPSDDPAVSLHTDVVNDHGLQTVLQGVYESNKESASLQIDRKCDVPEEQTDTTTAELGYSNLPVGIAVPSQTEVPVDEQSPEEVESNAEKSLESYMCECEGVERLEETATYVNESASISDHEATQLHELADSDATAVKTQEASPQSVNLAEGNEVVSLDSQVNPKCTSENQNFEPENCQLPLVPDCVHSTHEASSSVTERQEQISKSIISEISESVPIVSSSDGGKVIVKETSSTSSQDFEHESRWQEPERMLEGTFESAGCVSEEGVIELVSGEVKMSKGEFVVDEPIDSGPFATSDNTSEEGSEYRQGEQKCHGADTRLDSTTSENFDNMNTFTPIVLLENTSESLPGSSSSENTEVSVANTKDLALANNLKKADDGVERDTELIRHLSQVNQDLERDQSAQCVTDSSFEKRYLDDENRCSNEELLIGDQSVRTTNLPASSSEEMRPETNVNICLDEKQCDELHTLHLCTNPDTINALEDPPAGPSTLSDDPDLIKSQIDILKAVTAAFEEILELRGDGSDSQDTAL